MEIKDYLLWVLPLFILWLVYLFIKWKMDMNTIDKLKHENPAKIEALGKAVKDINSSHQFKFFDFFRGSGGLS